MTAEEMIEFLEKEIEVCERIVVNDSDEWFGNNYWRGAIFAYKTVLARLRRENGRDDHR